mgnify:FL=1
MGKEESAKAPPPAFEVNKGRILIDGIDVTEIVRPGSGDETPAPTNEDNAVLEGDEAATEAKQEPVEEPKKEAKAPEKEPDKEPEKPPEAEKLKFKIKFRGKEEEVEYEPTQIQVRLNKLRAFEENEKEFWERNKEVEPHRAIINSDWYKAKIKEAYETGELTQPSAPEEASPVAQYELLKRRAEPDYGVVMESLREYALNLPPEAVRILDSDPTVFLTEYDRVAEKLRKKQVEPPAEVEKADSKEVEKKLAEKESAKTRAAVTQPGTMTEPEDANKATAKKMKELERNMRDPSLAHRNLEFAAQLIMLRSQLKPTTQ